MKVCLMDCDLKRKKRDKDIVKESCCYVRSRIHTTDSTTSGIILVLNPKKVATQEMILLMIVKGAMNNPTKIAINYTLAIIPKFKMVIKMAVEISILVNTK